MPQVKINATAPDFELDDFQGNPVKLSDFLGKKNVVLVFNRGFTWPFCKMHLAQLRRDYTLFKDRDSEVIAVGPEGPGHFKSYWQTNDLPFIGLPDPDYSVLKLYGQEVNLFKLGRLPAQVIIDRDGIARFVHYGKSMSDIPSNKELLALLDSINETKLDKVAL